MKPLAERPLLSIIVPIFNEIATVETALQAIVAKEVPGWRREIIIVESNSTDGTRSVVSRFAHLPGVVIIFQERARGKGYAVREGFSRASGDVFLIQDADLEYDLNDYERLLTPLLRGTHTFVLGSRHTKSSWGMRKFNDQRFHAFALNSAHWAFTLLINASLGIWLNDPFTMYKIFRRECLDGITLTCNRFDLDWELLIKLVRAGHRPVEIPVTYRSRSFKEGKKISVFRDPLTWMVAWAKSRFGPLS